MSNGANNEPHRSLWLEEALAGREDAAPLEGPASADVAIIGGGYIGLWTALRLKQSSPDLDVVVLDADICGGGASGRNGGFALSWWAKLPSLVKLAGESGALQVCRESSDAVTELGEFANANGIDCDYRAGGWLWTARTDAQLGAWEGTVELAERLGADAFERLAPDEISRRAGSPQHLAGVLEPTAATVQPAALVRGLRRVALKQGVRIHEHTIVRRIDRSGMRVETDGGSVEAGKIVIANNAWAASIRELRRLLVVVSSDIVATEPIPDRLAEIGWTGGECITDCQQMIDYYRTTRDGRIAFGKGGWRIAYGGRIPGGFDEDARRAELVEHDLRLAYPQLADVPVTHSWSGPIDRSPTGLPLIGHLGGHPDIVYGVGWSGNGVAPSLIGGRILASLALDRDDSWARHPLVDQRVAPFPRSRSGSSAHTSSARACTARSRPRRPAAGPAGSRWPSPDWPRPGSRTSSGGPPDGAHRRAGVRRATVPRAGRAAARGQPDRGARPRVVAGNRLALPARRPRTAPPGGRPGGGLRRARGHDHARAGRAAGARRGDGRRIRRGSRRARRSRCATRAAPMRLLLIWGAPAITGLGELLDDL